MGAISRFSSVKLSGVQRFTLRARAGALEQVTKRLAFC
jgi:hypothetical protein